MIDICEKEEYIIFINSENVEDNPKEFIKWVRQGLILMQQNQSDDDKFTKLEKNILEKIDKSNQKEMSNKDRAWLTHVQLVLKSNSLKYNPEIQKEFFSEYMYN